MPLSLAGESIGSCRAAILQAASILLIPPVGHLTSFTTDRAVAIHVVEFDPITAFSWRFYNRGTYALNVYMRAATCLDTLEGFVGEEMMLRILRTFHMRFRYKHPHTQDFIDVVNEITGRDLTWFFEELFFSTLNFDYGIGSLASTEKKKFVRGVFDIEGKKEEYTQKKVDEMEEKEGRQKKRNSQSEKRF